jgi:AcrR family transcriptional regulator
MTRKSRLKARKQPRQSRSQETVAVILEAAARVLEERGLGGYNTNAVAARGGVSVGSIYQYFPNKDALTLALIARFDHELIEKVQVAVADSGAGSLRHSLKLLIRALIEAHAGRASLNRILETEEDRLRQSFTPSPAASQLKKVIASLLARHRAELATSIEAGMIDDLIVIVRAMVDAALQEDTLKRSAETRVLRAVEGYLHWR